MVAESATIEGVTGARGYTSMSAPISKPQTSANASRRTLFRFKEKNLKPAVPLTHYNAIKNLEEKDIRNLSRVIENSIVSQMRKVRSGRQSNRPGNATTMGEENCDGRKNY